jgi:hypothetical protein
MEEAGYTARLSPNGENVSFSKTESNDINITDDQVFNETKEIVQYDSSLDNYRIISSNSSTVGDLIIKIEIYQKN